MKPMAEALKELIKQRGVSDTDVWAAAGLTSGGLSHYKRGRRGTVLDDRAAITVRKLARYFEVDPSYFVEYRVWRLAKLGRLDAVALTAAYDAGIALAVEGGSYSELVAIEANLDDGEH